MVSISPNRQKFVWFVLSLVAVWGLSIALAFWHVRSTDRHMKRELLERAERIAGGLNSTNIRELTGTKADPGQPVYQRLKSFLAAVCKDNEDVRFAYLMGRNAEHEIIFLVDNEPPDSEEYSPPGQVYDEADESEHLVLDEGRSFTFDPMEDRWGEWVSAYVPVYDPATGDVLALFGMDVAASTWRLQQWAYSWSALFMAVVLTLIVGYAFGRTRTAGTKSERQTFWATHHEAFMIGLAGLAISVFVVSTTYRLSTYRLRESLQDLASSELGRAEQQLERVRDHSLPQLARFIEATPKVDAQSIDRFVSPLTGMGYPRAWGWVPKVSEVERAGVESRLPASGALSSTIWELADDGRRVPSPPQSVYYPLSTILPVERYGYAIGFNLGSEQRRLNALQEAERTGRPVATEPVTLVTDGFEERAMILLHPVYADQGEGALTGFALVTIELEMFLTQLEGGSPLHFGVSQLDDQGQFVMEVTTCPTPAQPRHDVGFAQYIQVYNRILRFTVHNAEATPAVRPIRSAAGAALVSGMVTLALMVLVGVPLRERRRLRAMVDKQTQHLVDRDRLLDAATRAAQILLAEREIDTAVNQALAILGRGCEQDRAYVFELHSDESGNKSLISQRYEWVREGVSSQLDNSLLQDIEFAETFQDWSDQLAAGKVITGHVQDLDQGKRRFFEGPATDAFTIIPVQVDGVLWGIFGFDECQGVRHWDEGEYAILLGMGTSMGAAIARRKAAAELHASLLRNQALLNALPDMMLLLSEDGTIIDYHAPDVWDLYLPADQFMNKKVSDILPQEPGAFALDAIQTVRNKGGVCDFTYSLPLNGETRHYEARMVPCGEQFLVDIRNISERVAQSEKLQRLSAAIEQSTETVVITDVDGAIEYVNPAFERITGYSREEALGNNPRILKSGVQGEAFYKELWETIASGRVWQGHLVNRRKDGTLYTEEASVTPIKGRSGAITDYVAIKRNITEELAREELLRHAQKMDSVGRLAGGVAHDFNNMLGIIQANAELALERVEKDAVLKEELNEIRDAALRSADLTRQLLAFARKQAIKPEILELNKIIKNMLGMLRRVIAENITLNWVPAKEAILIRIDPSQMDQLLVNLCVNARDAIDGTGFIEIDTALVELDAAFCDGYPEMKPGRYAAIQVRDSGCGMEKEVLDHIFEPFFTTKETGKGTGLGLATVYGIVQQNRGTVTVESVKGEGTTFTLYLPVCDAPESADETNATPTDTLTESNENHTIWVVEDEPGILDITNKLLQRWGYTVYPFSDPVQALQEAKQSNASIDLLLTDVIMPGMNGHELAEALHPLHPECAVLFMSGYSEDVISEKGIVSNDVNFIQKPFGPKQLAEKVSRALRRHRA